MSHEQSETIQLPNGEWANVYGRRTKLAGQRLPGTPTYPTVESAVSAARKRSEEYDPGLAAHLRDYPEGSQDMPEGSARRASVRTLLSDQAFKALPATDRQIIFDHVKSQDTEFQALPDTDQALISGQAFGESPARPAVTSSPFLEGLKRGASRTGELLAERFQGQGQNIGDIAKAIGSRWAGRPAQLPGSNVVEKALNLARVPLAPVETALHPLGAAIQTATEEVTRPFGVAPETARTASGLIELLASLGLSFTPTGTSAAAKAFQKFGLGRPDAAQRAKALQDAMQAEFPIRAPADIPLTFGDQIESGMLTNPQADDNLRAMFNVLSQGGKTPKVDKVFKKLSNLRQPGDVVARQDLGNLSRAASPSVEEISQQELATLQRLLNLTPPEGVPTSGTRVPGGPPLIFDVPPYQTEEQAIREAVATAEGRLPVPPGSGIRKGGPPVDPTATGYPHTQPPPTSQLPPELLAVSKGEAPAFLIPPAGEGTVPTVGEQALAGQDIPALARGLKLALFTGEDGTRVLYRAKTVPRATLTALDKEGRLAEIVNGPGTSPKPAAPTTAVTARIPEGTEIRTVLTNTPETTASAIKAQPAGTTIEVTPASEVGSVIQERMQGLRNTIEDARSSVPTGKQFYRDQEGNITKTGNAGALFPRFYELFPELRDLDPKITPKQLVAAIDKDKGNKVYKEIKALIGEQIEKERINPSAVAERPSDWADFERFSQAFDEVANAPDVKPTVTPPVGVQPRLLDTKATMPPTPLQAKAPQVEHGDLLAGFKKAEPEPPKLPLGEEPTGTVEMGMGLPVHKLGRAVKHMVQGFDDDTLPVRWFQSGRVQLNRLAPGLKIGDKIEAAKTEYRALQGTSQQQIDQSGMNTLSRPELMNMMQAQEGRAQPVDAKVARAVQTINQEREMYSRALQEVGAKVMVTKPYTDKATGAVGRMRFWKPYEPRQNYVPHLPDNREMVKYSPDDLAQRVQRFNRQLSAEDSRHVADLLLARAKGEPIPRTVPDQIIEWTGHGQPKSAHLFQRIGLVLPDEVRLLPNEAWPAYFQSTSREIALARQIGPADRDIEALRKAVAARPTDAALEALDTWDYWRGNQVKSPSGRFMDKLIAFGRNLTTARFMGPTTAIKQGSQSIPVFADTSVKNFVKAFGQSFRKSTKEEAARAGAHIDDLMQELTAEHLALSEAMHPAQSGLDKAVLVSERGAGAVSKVSGITTHDRFWRTVGFKATQQDLHDAIAAAKTGNAKALSLLKEHNLTPTSTPTDIDHAAAAFSAKVNLQSDPISLPAFIYKMPMFRLATHLSRFAIGQQQRMVRDFAIPLVKAGMNHDWSAFQRHALRIGKLVAGGVVGGEVLGDVLRTIAGRPDDRPGGTPKEFFNDLARGDAPGKIILQRIGDNILFASFLGYMQMAKEALYDPTTSDAKSLRVASMLLGPVGSSLVEGATRAGQLLTADTEPGPKSGKSEMDRAKTDALRTAIGSLTGVGRTVTQWTFPHTQGADKRRAEAAIARARNRGDRQEELDWKRWYQERQHERISPAALRKAMQEYTQ